MNGWKHKEHHRKSYIIAQYQIWISCIHSVEFFTWIMITNVNVNQNPTIFPYGSNFFNWKTNQNISFNSVFRSRREIIVIIALFCMLVSHAYCSILVHCTFGMEFICTFFYILIHVRSSNWILSAKNEFLFTFRLFFPSLPICSYSWIITYSPECEPAVPYNNIASQLNTRTIQVRGINTCMNTEHTFRF